MALETFWFHFLTCLKLLKSCKSTLPLTTIPKSPEEAELLLSFKNQILQLDF